MYRHPKKKTDPEGSVDFEVYKDCFSSLVAKLLRVSERTVRNWESGHHEIPYSAYKLLRMLGYCELPGKAWEGWHIAVGQLWSPEGFGFKPGDSAWWSALCRRAALFHVVHRENSQLRDEKRALIDKVAGALENAPALANSAVIQAQIPPSFAFSFSTKVAGNAFQAGVVAPPEGLNFENCAVFGKQAKSNAGAASRAFGGGQ